MNVHRGKLHEYLGMTLDHRKKGVFQITMFDYIKVTLEAFEKMDPKAKGNKNSAAPAYLFTMREDSKKLDAEKAEKFHSIVAKMLFATKRARPDTGPAVSYLTTRVREPDNEYWSKLAQLMKHSR